MNELYYSTASVKLNYFQSPKNGTPVLLIHGNMGRWQNFEPIIEELSQTKEVFAIDLRGHGKSSHVANSYLLKTHYQDVLSFIKANICSPVTLVGYSLGGMIALMIAAYHPELLHQIIVLEAPLTLKTLTPIIESQKEFGHKILHYRKTNQLAQLAKELNYDASSIGMSLCDSDIIEITIDQHEKMMEGFDINQLAPLIKCPFSILRGELQLGSMISDEDIELLKQHSPHVKDKKIQGIGHSILSEQMGIRLLLREFAPIKNPEVFA